MRADRRGLLLLAGPYLFGLVVLIALPALVTFGLAFFEYDLLRSPRFIDIGNFRELYGDEIFRTALENSLGFILLAVPLRLLGVVALALVLHPGFRGVGSYRAAAVLPTVVPDVAYALLWLWILNPLYGPLNLALGSVMDQPPSWLTHPEDAQRAVVLMSLFTIGEGFVIALAVRKGLPDELFELAAIEGARPWYVLGRITLPLMAPTLLLLVFRDTIFSFQANFVPALIVTEGGPPPYATTYLPLFVYQNAFEYLRYGYAAAASLVMFLVTAAIVYVQYLVIRRWRHAYAA
jgi:multiple sugar transport system permease protein